MTFQVRSLTRALKGHDSCLYAQETKPGRIDVMRASHMGDAPPHLLFSLTDSWQPQGTPTPWGIEVVLNRVKAHDLWRDDSFVERWIKDREKDEASKERDMRNSIESFLYELRPQFQRATSDINTSTLEKIYRKEA